MLKMAKLKYNFSILKNYVHELSDLAPHLAKALAKKNVNYSFSSLKKSLK